MENEELGVSLSFRISLMAIYAQFEWMTFC